MGAHILNREERAPLAPPLSTTREEVVFKLVEDPFSVDPAQVSTELQLNLLIF